MVIRIMILVGLTFISVKCFSQFAEDSLSLDAGNLSLLDETERLLSVTLTYKNCANRKILIYGAAGGPIPAPFPLLRFCEGENSGTGLAFAIFNENHDQQFPAIEISHDIDKGRLSKDRLDSMLAEMKYRFLKSDIVLDAKQELKVSVSVKLDDFELKSGRYYIQFVYYCGKKIFNVLTIDDLMKKESDLFQGCSFSDKVAFIYE